MKYKMCNNEEKLKNYINNLKPVNLDYYLTISDLTVLKDINVGNLLTVIAVNRHTGQITVKLGDFFNVKMNDKDEAVKQHLELQETFAYPNGYDGTWYDIKPKTEPQCECGVDTLGYGLHSHYCPKAES